jgi:flagellar basal body rod protein FlgG
MLKQQVDGEQTMHTVPMQVADLSQGVLEPTGNTFDFGIDGQGFFVVKEEGETFLTRDGRFHINADGYLVNSQGANVMGSSGPVHIPEFFQVTEEGQGAAKLEVAKDGTIRLNNEVHDKLRIARVDDPAGLERRGNSYFAAGNPGYIQEDDSSIIMQGYYEKGNVEPLNEMVDMMRNMQMFEAQQRAMRTTDETLAQVTSSLGRF